MAAESYTLNQCEGYKDLVGKKLCNDTHEYYIGECYVGSKVYTLIMFKKLSV